MNKDSSNLTQYFSYRLIIVFYLGILIFLCAVFIGIATITFPKIEINNRLSYFKCENGYVATFNMANVAIYETTYFWENDIVPDVYDQNLIRQYCSEPHQFTLEKWIITDKRLKDTRKKNLNINNIKYTIVYETTASFFRPINILFFGFLFSYIILNIFKETFIYLFLGRRFTWDWTKLKRRQKHVV